jgi:uncharacterized zinc-type alcohol dehydrogenase-like protein
MAFVAQKKLQLVQELQALPDEQAAALMNKKDVRVGLAEPRAEREVRAWGLLRPGEVLQPLTIKRKEPGPHDVWIQILFSGHCRSDGHHARNDWCDSVYPMVPGHEIVGEVRRVGARVRQFAPGAIVAVGNVVDSCRQCENCRGGDEQLCTNGGPTWTYNSFEREHDGARWLLPTGAPTMGGYSAAIVVNEQHVLSVPNGLHGSLERVAPLLCAGITVFHPLAKFGVRGKRVGVAGIGGLGHLAVKMAVKMGARVVALTTSEWKLREAKEELGAEDAVLTLDPLERQRVFGKLDLIIDTIPGPHSADQLLELLKPKGVLHVVGNMNAFTAVTGLKFVFQGKDITSSNTGGIARTQECLDFCADNDVLPDVELIAAHEISESMQQAAARKAHFRFVIRGDTF